MSTMNRCKLTAIALLGLLALSACRDSADDAPVAREFTVTLTAIDAVKQGSDEAVPIEGTPVDGATVTTGAP
jgi:outer membrane protein assembly factor BamE (lipoprotein component of BamABCDE complex)